MKNKKHRRVYLTQAQLAALLDALSTELSMASNLPLEHGLTPHRLETIYSLQHQLTKHLNQLQRTEQNEWRQMMLLEMSEPKTQSLISSP